MKLFFSATSPYVRKVLVTAHELGLAERLDIVPTSVSAVKPDAKVMATSPAGKVPCLIPDEGSPIFDSRVICQYLASLGPEGASLYPEARRFEVLTLEALADAILDAALLCRFETFLRPEALYWADWYRGQMAKVESGLQALEGERFASLTGAFHAGALASACALGYIDLRFPEAEWRARQPKLAAWFAEISERASMKATMPQA